MVVAVRRRDIRAARKEAVKPQPPVANDDNYWDGDEGEQRDTTCRYCSGTGGDPWNDGITPCEHCDGEGYEWWN